MKKTIEKIIDKKVTILILVETPLQPKDLYNLISDGYSHNPYFSGNSFATQFTIYGRKS